MSTLLFKTNITQLVIYILSSLRTTQLLPLSAVSRRFHSVILRLIYQRLSLAVNLQKHILLLECFPPSRRLFQPALPCTYLGTNGLDDCNDHDDDVDCLRSPGEDLRKLRDLCSRFRPHRQLDPERKVPKHPAGDVPGSRTYVAPEVTQPGPSQDAHAQQPAANAEEQLVTQDIHLDSAELFTQLCAQTSVAIPGPSLGIYHDYIDINSGVVRLFRHWLAKEAQRKGESSEEEHPGVLWANDGEQVGVKFRVTQKAWKRNTPIIMSADEDMPVSYEIQYEGMCGRAQKNAQADIMQRSL